MIIPVYKPLGASSHALAKKVGEIVGEKATHTGTLDPMADGVLVVLTGEDRFQKGVLNEQKMYSFSFAVGLTTDSLDVLGEITSVADAEYTQDGITNQITEILPTFVGSQHQTQPLFSAQRVQGSSAFELAKANQDFSPRINEIYISSLDFIKITTLAVTDFFAQAARARAVVTGNFRQEEIEADWAKHTATFLQNGVTQLVICTCSTTVSKKTYIRSLVRDIGVALSAPTVTTAITRTKNGEFSLTQAECWYNTHLA